MRRTLLMAGTPLLALSVVLLTAGTSLAGGHGGGGHGGGHGGGGHGGGGHGGHGDHGGYYHHGGYYGGGFYPWYGGYYGGWYGGRDYGYSTAGEYQAYYPPQQAYSGWQERPDGWMYYWSQDQVVGAYDPQSKNWYPYSASTGWGAAVTPPWKQ
jgi:hypothetical protein